MVGDVLDVVVAGLTAGAAAGAKDTASTAVKDAYASLVARARRRFGHTATDGLQHLATQPNEDRERQLRDRLVQALDGRDLGPDDDLVTAARTLLRHLGQGEEAGGLAATYAVDVRDSEGVQIGDHNTMTLNLGPRPEPPSGR